MRSGDGGAEGGNDDSLEAHDDSVCVVLICGDVYLECERTADVTCSIDESEVLRSTF